MLHGQAELVHERMEVRALHTALGCGLGDVALVAIQGFEQKAPVEIAQRGIADLALVVFEILPTMRQRRQARPRRRIADLRWQVLRLDARAFAQDGESLDDVLERFYYAAKSENPDWLVRLTSDCPLIDPVIIDEVIKYAVDNDCDYASNTLNPTYPDGLDVEVF